MAIDKNKCVVVLICQLNLYYIMLEIKKNIDYFNNKKHGL